MDPQFSLLIGEKMLIANTRLRHNKIDTAENNGEIRNIITLDPKSPRKQVNDEKYLKCGLKFGADASPNPRQAMLTVAYVKRNRQEQS